MYVCVRVCHVMQQELNQSWEEVRKLLLEASGLRDVDDTNRIGTGYTGHCFNDHNHCDATAMLLDVGDSLNSGQVHRSIARGNPLGDGIRAASIPLGRTPEEASRDDGGTWCTCMNGCNAETPSDVAHMQFRSMIAFKLVWCPPNYESFVIVDDDGTLLTGGTPVDDLPHIRYRQGNFALVAGSKYATEAERYALRNQEERSGGSDDEQ